MLKKDEIKILDELTELIKNKIKTEYRDSRGKPVESIENISIVEIKYDTENQDRNKIIVKEFLVAVRLHILFLEDSTSSYNTQFKNNKPIEFKINSSTNEVELIEPDVKFIEKKLF